MPLLRRESGAARRRRRLRCPPPSAQPQAKLLSYRISLLIHEQHLDL